MVASATGSHIWLEKYFFLTLWDYPTGIFPLPLCCVAEVNKQIIGLSILDAAQEHVVKSLCESLGVPLVTSSSRDFNRLRSVYRIQIAPRSDLVLYALRYTQYGVRTTDTWKGFYYITINLIHTQYAIRNTEYAIRAHGKAALLLGIPNSFEAGIADASASFK